MAISPELHEHSARLIEQRELMFGILRDPRNEVAHAFGLRWRFPEDLKGIYLQFEIDLARNNDDDSWTLAVPGRYIIDREGVIRYARVDPDYTRRPEPRETLEALRRLTG